MTVVADLTERELVARIQRRLSPAPGWLLVGIGDDAAVVEPERNRVEVLTVDAIEMDPLDDRVDGQHLDPIALGLHDRRIVADADEQPAGRGRKALLNASDELAFSEIGDGHFA